MVMLQVVQVNDIFAQIDKLRSSKWQEVCSDSSKRPRTVPRRKPRKKLPPVERDLSPLPKRTPSFPKRVPFLPHNVVVVQHCHILPKFVDILSNESPVDFPQSKVSHTDDTDKNSRLKSRGIASIATSVLKEAIGSAQRNHQMRSEHGCIQKPKPIRANRQKIVGDSELRKIMTEMASDTQNRKKLKSVTFDINHDTEENEKLAVGYEENDFFKETRDVSTLAYASAPIEKDAILSKFSYVTDVWSNNENFEDPSTISPSSSVSVASQCPTWRKLSKKSGEKDLRNRKLDDSEASITWTQSESQPFIPISKETLASLALGVRNAKRCYEVLSPTGISKLDRMKNYDSSRKKNFEKRQMRKSNEKAKSLPEDFNFLGKSDRRFTVQYFLSPQILKSNKFAKFSDRNFHGLDDGNVDKKINFLLPFDGDGVTTKSEAKKISIYFTTAENIKRFCKFWKFNRTFCRLSLYLYVYAVLSLVLIIFKLATCKRFFLESKFQ